MFNHEILSKLNVYTAKGFEEEYERIVSKKPDRYKIDEKLFALLQLLSKSQSISALCETRNFEKLKNTPGIYAIRIRNKYNIRVLFSIEKNGSILLHTFEEKQGKKKTDYSSAIPVAKDRLRVFQKGDKA